MGTDSRLAERDRDRSELEARAQAIRLLHQAEIPFVVGGAYAYGNYTGIYRDTKDLDLFPRRQDALRALEVLADAGWETERTDEIWLYKAFRGEYFVDFIFSSGNGVAEVDDAWFEHALPGEAFGHKVMLAPVEEMIWSKAFVLERERFDGSDVMHLLRAQADRMDWPRLLRRFDRYWEVLFSQLMLFWFAYPSERSKIPRWVMLELKERLGDSLHLGSWAEPICRGPLLSRVNFRVDLDQFGYTDGRSWDEDARTSGGQLGEGSHPEDPGRGGW
jgi:hypothetical protein